MADAFLIDLYHDPGYVHLPKAHGFRIDIPITQHLSISFGVRPWVRPLELLPRDLVPYPRRE